MALHEESCVYWFVLSSFDKKMQHLPVETVRDGTWCMQCLIRQKLFTPCTTRAKQVEYSLSRGQNLSIRPIGIPYHDKIKRQEQRQFQTPCRACTLQGQSYKDGKTSPPLQHNDHQAQEKSNVNFTISRSTHSTQGPLFFYLPYHESSFKKISATRESTHLLFPAHKSQSSLHTFKLNIQVTESIEQ